MRPLAWVLAGLLLLVQVDLWLGKGNIRHVWDLQARLGELQASNDAARERNAAIQTEVDDLAEGLEIVEEHARADLDMVRPDEILVRIAASAPR